MKGVNLKVVVDLIHESWNEVTKETIGIKFFQSSAEAPIPSTQLLAELYQLATDDESEYEANFRLSSTGNLHGSGLWHG